MIDEKAERQIKYVLNALKKHSFCPMDLDCDDFDLFKIGMRKFLYSPPSKRTKKILGALRTTNNPIFKGVDGGVITPPIYEKITFLMQVYFPEDDFWKMTFSEVKGRC